MDGNLFDALVSDKAPEAPALILSGGRTISYGELRKRTAQLAWQLVDSGIRPGDRVAAQVEKSADALMLYLASLRAGAVYLPLNTGYTGAEVGYFVSDARPGLLVVSPAAEAQATSIAESAGARLATLGDDGHSGSLLAGLDAHPAEFDDVPRGRDDLAAILYTSGTTGRSKGAMLTHGNLLSNARALVEVWRFTSRDVLLHALPIYHTHGLFVATNVSLLAGAAIRLLPRFEPDAVLAGFAQCSVMMGVPTFYTRLLADPRLNREVVREMRLFVSGSAPLLAETHRMWEAVTGHRILERYGMTETNMNTSNPYDGERRPGTVGCPLPGVSVRIVEEASHKPLPCGEIGMIEVKGLNVFSGYWGMPEKTRESMTADGYFITGDLGRMSADGYVEIVGRGKDLIITGGLNVYPKEVENEIDAIAGVEESAVIGLPHPDFGEAVAAVVVRRGAAAVNEGETLQTLSGRLARFKLPKAVIFLDTLPRNSMGKVQKNILRDRFAAWFIDKSAGPV